MAGIIKKQMFNLVLQARIYSYTSKAEGEMTVATMVF